MFNDESPKRISGFMLMLSLFIASSTLGYGLYNAAVILRQGPRKLNAVGSAEKVVKSNSGKFRILCVSIDKNTETLKNKNQELLKLMHEFLESENVKTADISLSTHGSYRLQDKEDIYLMTTSISITGDDVDFIKQLATKAVLFMNNSTVFVHSTIEEPTYEFNGLQELKNELLPEAIKNGYESAQKMIIGKNNKIGDLINVRQGYIDDYNSYSQSTKIMKRAKIVVDLSFELQ